MNAIADPKQGGRSVIERTEYFGRENMSVRCEIVVREAGKKMAQNGCLSLEKTPCTQSATRERHFHPKTAWSQCGWALFLTVWRHLAAKTWPDVVERLCVGPEKIGAQNRHLSPEKMHFHDVDNSRPACRSLNSAPTKLWALCGSCSSFEMRRIFCPAAQCCLFIELLYF